MALRWYVREFCRTYSDSLERRWPRQSKVSQHIDQGGKAPLTIGLDIDPRLIEKAGAGPQADPAITHIV